MANNGSNNKLKNSIKKESKGVNFKVDVPMLNMFIKLALSAHTQRKTISNLDMLFNRLDLGAYGYNEDIVNKVKILRLICEAKRAHNLEKMDTIKLHVENNIHSDLVPTVENISWTDDQLTVSEVQYLEKIVGERVKVLFLLSAKEEIMSLYDQLDSTEMVSFVEIANQLKSKLSELMVSIQNTTMDVGMMREFSFSGDNFRDLLNSVIDKAKTPTTYLQTGIRQLNAILSPAFRSGRLYTILGLSGKFKSGTMLNIACQIRDFNPQIKPVEKGLRKTILFITMENGIEETIERVFDMYNTEEGDMSTLDYDTIFNTLVEKGKFNFTNEVGIDIDLRYYADSEISTADIYSIIKDLELKGKKVIMLVLDYLKKIESAKPHYGDERIRLLNAAVELKVLSQYFAIPVLTAMQINRAGNTIVDSAMRDSKQDLLKFVGSGDVGKSWDIIEESDWVCIVNLEMQLSTGQTFLTFKRTKIRGKKDPLASDYFNHPFTNEKNICLMTDVDKPYSASIKSLASDLESVNTEENKRTKPTNSAQERPKLEQYIKTVPINVIDAIKETNRIELKQLDL